MIQPKDVSQKLAKMELQTVKKLAFGNRNPLKHDIVLEHVLVSSISKEKAELHLKRR